MRRHSGQVGPTIAGISFRKRPKRYRPMQRPIALNECQVRCNDQLFGNQQSQYGLGAVIIEEPCENSA